MQTQILFCGQCQRMQGLCPSRYSAACNVHLSPGLVPLYIYIFPWQISQSSGFSIFGVSNTQVLFPQLFSVAFQVFCSGTCHILGLGGSLKLWVKIHNPFTPLCIFPSWKALPNSEAILGQILVPSSHIGSSDYYCCFVGVEHSLGLFLFKLEVLAPKALSLYSGADQACSSSLNSASMNGLESTLVEQRHQAWLCWEPTSWATGRKE